ncbi:SMI1/KNR4 family protein [Mesorhizobium sp. BR1-1-9]|uniref:SMI1/KNR4 family protein n=1 Tax=Mesorhizobium sp. BR1-1-9 TaxID=2876646 RepID=UPI001CD0C592|nr:SMI1/KNR4 family protein [Mesorhizobium sp. BR1-1-9]MBZ9870526.1 SMI1/KNR4 family protein [Mesorhizobium sp. BR1-1-9]
MSKQSNIIALADRLLELMREYYLLAVDKEYPGKRGEPASEKQIAKTESILGRQLPADFRMFLSKYNGWSRFEGAGKILSTEDHGTPWEADIIESWTSIWESDDDDPFKSDHLLIVAGDGLPYFIVLIPNKEDPNGDPVFVEYEYMNINATFKTFEEYLTYRIGVTESSIDEKRNGREED